LRTDECLGESLQSVTERHDDDAFGLGGERDPATAKLAQIIRMGLGGKVGSGRQWVSWVGLNDLLDALIRAIDEPRMSGVYHAEMKATYRRLLRRRVGLPTPAIVAQLGAPLLGSSASLASPAVDVCQPGFSRRGSSSTRPTSRQPHALRWSDASRYLHLPDRPLAGSRVTFAVSCAGAARSCDMWP
jgi:hypothetical protein